MNPFSSTCLAVVLGLAVGTPLAAQHRYVDAASVNPRAPYDNWIYASTNIPEAIIAAASGDTIWVAPGVYPQSGAPVYIHAGKRINLISTRSRGAIIDAQGQSVGLRIGESNVVVEGFVVQNGYDTNAWGGGVQLNASATLRDCLIWNNRAKYGGGVFVGAPGAILQGCTVSGNTAEQFGGGAVLWNITTNMAYVQASEIKDNTAGTYGGGLYINGKVQVEQCTIRDNHATSHSGGGIYMNGGALVNTVISDNSAKTIGGGVHSTSLQDMIINCTITTNMAENNGGGVNCQSGALVNSIVYYNTAPTNGNLTLGASATAQYCCVTPSPGFSNIELPPEFEDLLERNFGLRAYSPCVDAGTATNAPEVDYKGRPRSLDGDLDGMPWPDVGALEHQFRIRLWYRTTNEPVAVLSWDARTDRQYVVETAGSLYPIPAWTPVVTTTVSVAGVATQEVAMVVQTSAMYRVSVPVTLP